MCYNNVLNVKICWLVCCLSVCTKNAENLKALLRRRIGYELRRRDVAK